MKKTVLILAPNIYPYPGGAETYIYDLMNHIKKEYNVICVTENPPKKITDGIEYVKATANINKIASKETVTWREMIFSLLDQMKTLENKNIDIIHANSIEATFLGKIISLQLNIPIVCTIHEHNPEDKAFGIGRVRFIYENLRVDGIITPSTFYYEKALKYSNDLNKIFKIFHGIDNDKMPQVINKTFRLESEDIFNIVFVGRVYPTKGLIVLIRALGKLKRYNPSWKFYLKIIGPITDKKYYKKILLEINNFNLNDNIGFYGSMLFEKVSEIISQSNLFVAPSCHEGFGLSIVEAMLLKTVVIGSAVDGILDIIEDNINGFLFQSNNDDELAQKILYVYNNYANLKDIIDNAYQKSINEFSINRMTDHTLKVYNEVIERYRHEG